MKLFSWKSAGREASRPVLSRVFPAWRSHLGEWPSAYEPQVRDGYVSNPVAQRAVRLVVEAVATVPITASDDRVTALIAARSGGQALLETLALHVLLHGNAYAQVLPDADGHPRELFALRPERVTIEADARGWPVALTYRAGALAERLAIEDAAGRAAIVHVKAAHPLDDHYGWGVWGRRRARLRFTTRRRAGTRGCSTMPPARRARWSMTRASRARCWRATSSSACAASSTRCFRVPTTPDDR